MENLTPAEQELIRNHRAANRRKLEAMAATLRENGYTVVAPTMAVLPDFAPAPLVPNQSSLLEALKATYAGRGATLAEVRHDHQARTGETMNRGASGTAIQCLMRKGLVKREGDRYYAI